MTTHQIIRRGRLGRNTASTASNVVSMVGRVSAQSTRESSPAPTNPAQVLRLFTAPRRPSLHHPTHHPLGS